MNARSSCIALGFLLMVAPTVHAQPAPLPSSWPVNIELGMGDSPGGAAAMKSTAPFAFRYQYLAGGVDTGRGWSTWNPDGTFASMYVRESHRAKVLPVLTYYQLLQSGPQTGGEAERDLRNLRDPDLMRAYYADLALALDRIRARRRVVAQGAADRRQAFYTCRAQQRAGDVQQGSDAQAIVRRIEA